MFLKEPLEESELFNLENIILTPHIAASTDEAQIVVLKWLHNQFCEYFKNNNCQFNYLIKISVRFSKYPEGLDNIFPSRILA